jgi:hypothetical protein
MLFGFNFRDLFMLSIIKQPWLHFLIIGSFLYGLQWYFSEPEVFVIDPPSQAQIDELREQWISSAGRLPTEEESQQLIDVETNREILFQEALRQELHLADEVIKDRLIFEVAALDPDYDPSIVDTRDDEELLNIALAIGLHKNDSLIRKRLIQQMVLTAYESVGDEGPDDQILLNQYQQAVEANNPTLMQPATISFQHIFLNPEQHTDVEAAAQQLFQQVSSLPFSAAKQFSDPFQQELSSTAVSEEQVSQTMGEGFALELFKQAKQQFDEQRSSPVFLPPVSSNYGEHIVWLESYQPASMRSFEQVRKVLLIHWRRQQQELALDKMMRELHQLYSVRAASTENNAEHNND